MCGIVGYCGREPVLQFLIEGLKRLEYRGYDSAGVGLVDRQTGHITVVKEVGKIAQGLIPRLQATTVPESTVGLAHTRWATHGAPSQHNSHPHVSCHSTVAVVHNGTIENFDTLKRVLEDEGHMFSSGTDTEVIAHLLEASLAQGLDLVGAVQELATGKRRIIGAYGIAVISRTEPGRLVAACNGSPLVVGISDHGTFVASDVVGFREHTDKVQYLNDHEMAVLDSDGTYEVRTMLTNGAVIGSVQTVDWDLEQIAKGGYPHFMLREIMEQNVTIRATLAGRLTDGDRPKVHLGGMTEELEKYLSTQIREIVITACGTSFHSGLIAERVIEKLLGINVRTRYASELATGHAPMDSHTLIITVSQSGETKDTIEAALLAQKRGARVWNICNRVGTRLTRIAHSGMYLHVGPEIGVASTKAFTSQVVALILTVLKLVEIRKPADLRPEAVQRIVKALLALPDQVAEVLADAEHVRDIAAQFADSRHFLYLGRGYNYPTALEGALKLKEISYIHAEGYPAGEMKHGPIALIDQDMPVVFIMPQEGEDEATYRKVISNVEEVAARGGRVILVASQGDPLPEQKRSESKVERILYIPQTIAMLTPVLASIYLQLLAYHIAVIRGCDIDQPRNLAKSVTVE